MGNLRATACASGGGWHDNSGDPNPFEKLFPPSGSCRAQASEPDKPTPVLAKLPPGIQYNGKEQSVSLNTTSLTFEEQKALEKSLSKHKGPIRLVKIEASAEIFHFETGREGGFNAINVIAQPVVKKESSYSPNESLSFARLLELLPSEVLDPNAQLSINLKFPAGSSADVVKKIIDDTLSLKWTPSEPLLGSILEKIKQVNIRLQFENKTGETVLRYQRTPEGLRLQPTHNEIMVAKLKALKTIPDKLPERVVIPFDSVSPAVKSSQRAIPSQNKENPRKPASTGGDLFGDLNRGLKDFNKLVNGAQKLWDSLTNWK